MSFPAWFLSVIVYGSIALTAVGVVALVVLVVKDLSSGRLW
jgi:hypothetical protein